MDFLTIFKRSAVPQASKPSPHASESTSYQERIVRVRGEETSLTVAAVYRAAEIRSNALAGLTMQYMTRDHGHNYLYEDNLTGYGRRVNYLLQVRPNKKQNAFQFWKQIEMMRIFRGHAYIFPVWDDMSSDLVALIPTDAAWNQADNTYALTDTQHGYGGTIVSADELIVIRGIVTTVHPEGESVIHYAGRALEVSATSEAMTLESSAKGGRQKLILQEKDGGGYGDLGLNKDEAEKERKRFQKSIYQDDVAIVNGAFDVTAYNLSMADMQLLESRKFSISDIARFFGVPRTLLGDAANANYKSGESANLEFLTHTLQPLIREIEDELNAKLITPTEYAAHRFRFDTRSLFAMDITTQSAYNKSRLETGVASVNDLRAEANMPSLENGDEHYVSCNVAPIGSPKLSGQQPNQGLTQ